MRKRIELAELSLLPLIALHYSIPFDWISLVELGLDVLQQCQETIMSSQVCRERQDHYLNKKVDGNQVVRPSRNDDIGILLRLI